MHRGTQTVDKDYYIPKTRSCKCSCKIFFYCLLKALRCLNVPCLRETHWTKAANLSAVKIFLIVSYELASCFSVKRECNWEWQSLHIAIVPFLSSPLDMPVRRDTRPRCDTGTRW